MRFDRGEIRFLEYSQYLESGLREHFTVLWIVLRWYGQREARIETPSRPNINQPNDGSSG